LEKLANEPKLGIGSSTGVAVEGDEHSQEVKFCLRMIFMLREGKLGKG
jgi:hypothetical protein